MVETRQKLTRTEIITAMSHYYRAEVQRSLAWRERLDRTTNWAVAGSAAFLGFGFAHPEIHHSLFLFSFAIVYILLGVESRRYRFYDAYEYRVRLLNEHFMYGILAEGDLNMDPDDEISRFWRAEVASDLRYPQYKMGFRQALARRMRANYGYLFGILLLGWLVKIMIHPRPAGSLAGIVEHAAIGDIPGFVTLVFMLLFAGHVVVILSSKRSRKPAGGGEILHRR